MTRNLKIIISLILASVLFHSCKKNSSVSYRDELTANDWYPYQTHIDSYDTITVISTDNSGQSRNSANTFKFDTTYILDPCFQQSTFSFQSDGRLKISNMCSVGQLTIDTTWATSSDQALFMLFIKDSTADTFLNKISVFPIFGGDPALDLEFFGVVITKINSSTFEVSQFVTEYPSEMYYVNNNPVDSVAKIHMTRVITFKSR